MGRKKKNTVYRYFDIDDHQKTSTCLINGCGKILKTQHGANLLKHLKHMHQEQFKLTIEVNNTIPVQRSTSTESIIKECTNLVAIHGRPFSLIDDDAFQNLLKMIPNNDVTINAQKIRSNLQTMAEQLRDEMATILQGKMLCLKVDIASIATRCFLGINCQYTEDGHIILKNLAVTEIFERHTSEHLKDLLIYNLQKFRIDIQQVYSITTDNGANMIKMTKLMNEATTNVTSDTAEAGSVNWVFGGRLDKLHGCIGTSSSQIINHEDSDSDQNTEEDGSRIESITLGLLENLGTQFHTEVGYDEVDFSIGLVRCAAHTLQLALQDASNSVNRLLLECREVVRRLRTPQFVRIIRQQNKLIPKLDCTTRWHSTVDMAQSLIDLKEMCTTNERLHLPLDTWSALEDFVKSMIPGKILTKKLQAEQLTVGDFYLEWMLCQYKLAKINTEIGTCIITKMKERENVLFESDTFINAIFLDPRVNSILTPDQRRRAKDNLIKLFFRHNKLQHKDAEKENRLEEANAVINEISEARADLDDFLNVSYINRLSDLTCLLRRDDPRGELIINLQQSFNLFLKEPLLKSTENVLSYWEKSKLKFPYLYKLSTIVLATPMTQVSVERLFSSLRFIVSNHRFSMTDQIIDDILYLRSNSVYGK